MDGKRKIVEKFYVTPSSLLKQQQEALKRLKNFWICAPGEKKSFTVKSLIREALNTDKKGYTCFPGANITGNHNNWKNTC